MIQKAVMLMFTTLCETRFNFFYIFFSYNYDTKAVILMFTTLYYVKHKKYVSYSSLFKSGFVFNASDET
ncbi:hypothetical protein HanRHA438_Chr03g0100601 [Helianthus annuus]|nr:hypothetical protein HanRHA438_Chr03g0100601 [Helianthus annuus]